jgi:hypothetical protein
MAAEFDWNPGLYFTGVPVRGVLWCIPCGYLLIKDIVVLTYHLLYCTYDSLKLYVTWPGMFNDVEEYITNCKICQKNKFTGSNIKAPFQETDTQFHPWDKLYLDIVGPLHLKEEGHKCILTCHDNLSKYLLAVPMIIQAAVEVDLTFMRCVILQYGIPHFTVTDQGIQFMEDMFKRL